MRKFDQQLLRLKAALGITSDQEIANLLGLSKAAFSDRKKRDSFPEDKLFALVTTRPDLVIDPAYVLSGSTARERYESEHKRAPVNYEDLARYAIQEKAAGSQNPTQTLSADEIELLALYRAATLKRKMEVVALLSDCSKGGEAGVNVQGDGNRTAGRDYHE